MKHNKKEFKAIVDAYESRAKTSENDQFQNNLILIESLKVFRVLIGLSVREFATDLGISYSYLSAVENQKKPVSKTLIIALKKYLIRKEDHA